VYALHHFNEKLKGMRQMKALLIALSLFLTSCANYQATMAAQQTAEAQAAANYERALAETKKAQNDADDAQCRSYGVKPGSQPDGNLMGAYC
jgi:hypothetical protein